LAARVTGWVDDPRVPERQVGWVTLAATPSNRPDRRVAGRCRNKNGPWGVGVLIATLAPQEVLALTQQPVDRVNDSTAVVLP